MKGNSIHDKRDLTGREIRTFQDGQQVIKSGIYKVSHSHAVRAEARLLKGGIFPGCARCKDRVSFDLIGPIPAESASERFRLLMRS